MQKHTAWFSACCVALASAASAQDQPTTGEVSGTAFDSVGKAPLREATVQMVPPAGTPLFTATTDARGRYTISGAPPGRYFIELRHPVLDSLALEPPLRSVEVKAGQNARIDLAVPAPATIVSQLCRTTPKDSLGLLFGQLRDSRSQAAEPSGEVEARWFEMVIDKEGTHSSDRTLSSATNGDGWFAICGVPAGVDIIVSARRGTDSTGLTIVSIPGQGLRRFDLDVGGTGSVIGHIQTRGKPVLNARVRAGSVERYAYTDSSGAFRLGGVPAGTQTIEVRAIGYAPEARAVNLSPDAETVVNVELTTVKHVMDTIQVVAQRLYSIDAMGFERRRRSAAGKFFDENDARRRASFSIFQLLYEVPSLRIEQEGAFQKRILMRGGNSFTGLPCPPAFFLDGVRMPADYLSDLDLLVRPGQMAGMEVYRGMMVPQEFYVTGACGAIAVWTIKHPRSAKNLRGR
jgi:hypothetical protein